MKTLIKNGRVIDPKNHIDEVMDVLIADGIIAKVACGIDEEADEIIDAIGLWVTPGLIDLHVHLREPGFEHKETIKTGSLSAAMGGFTTICCMPNTEPVIDNEILVEYVKMKAEREAVVNVLPIGSITKGQKGEELANIGKMVQSGVCSISEDGKSVENPALMKTALKYAGMFNLPVMSHCEEARLSGKGQINAGNVASILGLKGISNDSEDVMVSRDILLAEGANAKLHICHISTDGSVRLLRNAKQRLLNVTGEVTPHHFTLIDDDITDYDTNYKMNPPLRNKRSRDAVLEGLMDGTIDCIATDHAPHHYDEKQCEFELAANGIVGLETAVPLAITELVMKNVITPLGFVEKLSLNPAKILGINKGTLTPGAVADVAVFDIENEYEIDVAKFLSKAKNSPFGGRKVVGRALYTIVAGNCIVRDGKITKGE